MHGLQVSNRVETQLLLVPFITSLIVHGGISCNIPRWLGLATSRTVAFSFPGFLGLSADWGNVTDFSAIVTLNRLESAVFSSVISASTVLAGVELPLSDLATSMLFRVLAFLRADASDKMASTTAILSVSGSSLVSTLRSIASFLSPLTN